MSAAANEQILLTIKTIQESAKKAEKEFKIRNNEIQKKSRKSIDLFGGDAPNRVVELASDARKACDELYSSYQTLVAILDRQCRPFLDENPSVEAVYEVKKLIKWLNDESEIENNYAASLNNNNLGNILSAKYVPTIENKMIQKFWEQTFDHMPGANEIKFKEKEKKRKEEESIREAQRLVEKFRKESENATTLSENDESKKTDNYVQKKLKQFEDLENNILNHILSLKTDLSNIEKEREAKLKLIDAQIVQLQKERKNAGLFGIKQKKAIDEQISELIKKKNALFSCPEESDLKSQIHDSEKKLIQIKDHKSILKPKCGDILHFGTDPLSGNKNSISWIVVQVTASYVALLSRDIIGYAVFKNEWHAEKQDYVQWLKEFENSAFSDTEKAGLLKSPIDYYESPTYAFVFTKSDVKNFSPEWLAAEATSELLESIQGDENIYMHNKQGHINLAKSSYWLHSRDSWNELTVNRVKLKDSGEWTLDTLGKVTNDEFPAGIRPAVLLSRTYLADQVPTEIQF